MVTLNGVETEIKENMTLTELLEEKKFRMALIAVEYNGTIPKREEYGTIILRDGDVIEAVGFMGGG